MSKASSSFADDYEAISNVRSELGENPLWDDINECLYWTDIPAGEIHCFDMACQSHEIIYKGCPVGGFTLQRNGELLLFRINDVALLKRNEAVRPILSLSENGMDRFNDVIAAPDGGVFAGSIGTADCGLYRVNCDGGITKLFSGTTCSNGMGFSVDRQTFYWTCSTSRRIFKFNYCERTGELSNRTLFYQATEGTPDGLTVDRDGFVWSAHWGGSCIKRISPQGKIVQSISLPVRRISSACFGGENLNDLFVTSAKDTDTDESLGGSVFKISPGVKGVLDYRSNIEVPDVKT
jgi:sugar lactone lactonase YvrE